MATLAQYKKNSQADLDKISKELSKLKSGSQNYNSEDDRFWQPATDKSGNGYAVIRFLPAIEGEEVPWVRIFSHGFKGPTGSWYIENSLTTLKQPDPVAEYNNRLWNSGIESDKEVARVQKRRLTFISNILVVKDAANPANEGKVFLFKYGKKIFDKLNEAMNPQFDDETPVNPFHPVTGANFKLKIRQVEGYRNYDKSELDEVSQVTEDEKEWARIQKSMHSLQQFLDPSNFKSYDELKAKLDRVLGASEVSSSKKAVSENNVVSLPKGKTAARREEFDDEDEDLDSILNELKDED